MNDRPNNVNRTIQFGNMTVRGLVVTLFIVGLVAFEPGNALQCYVCRPTNENDCVAVTDDMLQDCPNPTTSTSQPETSSATSPESTTASSSATSPQPESTTASSSATSPQPESTTASSSATSPQPESTTASSSATSPQPESTTASSSATSPQPESTSPQPESTTASSSATSPQPQSSNPPERRRRSVFGKFARADPFNAKAETFRCYKADIKDNSSTQVTGIHRGCTPIENLCANMTDCNTCTTDRCNSATSNTVISSMIVSLFVILLLTI